MPLSEDDVRALVRDSIARHARQTTPNVWRDAPPPGFRGHASHVLLPVLSGGDGDPDGTCLIEPAVRCNHCGYCQSYGH